MAHSIDIGTVRHIARLSRLDLSDEELAKLQKELGDIIGHFDKLQQLDTNNVEPMAHAVELHNVLAKDIVGESLTPDEALANAPARDGDFFKVPKVLGESS